MDLEGRKKWRERERERASERERDGEVAYDNATYFAIVRDSKQPVPPADQILTLVLLKANERTACKIVCIPRHCSIRAAYAAVCACALRIHINDTI